jgi:hypothetical protein
MMGCPTLEPFKGGILYMRDSYRTKIVRTSTTAKRLILFRANKPHPSKMPKGGAPRQVSDAIGCEFPPSYTIGRHGKHEKDEGVVHPPFSQNCKVNQVGDTPNPFHISLREVPPCIPLASR